MSELICNTNFSSFKTTKKTNKKIKTKSLNNRNSDFTEEDKSKPKGQPITVDKIMNKGYSVLEQENNPFKELDKIVGKPDIFKNEIHVLEKEMDKMGFSETPTRSSFNKNMTYWDEVEMRKVTGASVVGSYVVGSKSFVNEMANKHYDNKLYSSQVFTDTYSTLRISQNHKINFPRVNQKFFDNAITVFNVNPVEGAFSENYDMQDIMQDKEQALSMLQFFMKYGTHYINKGHFGFKAGFTATRPSNEGEGEVDGKGANKSEEKVSKTTQVWGTFQPAGKAEKKPFIVGNCSKENDRLNVDTCSLKRTSASQTRSRAFMSVIQS